MCCRKRWRGFGAIGRTQRDEPTATGQYLVGLHRLISGRTIISNGRLDMRLSKSCLVVLAALLASTLGSGQASPTRQQTSLLVRMSFTNSWLPQGFANFPQICFSVDRSGHYEMRRLTMKVSTESSKENPDKKFVLGAPYSELLQGTLSSGELGKLEKFLEDPEFVKLSSSTPSLLRKGAETFVAEVPRESRVQRVVISNADGENPFPRSTSRFVNWLQHFKAEGAEPLDVSADDICPSGTFQPVNPAAALLQPMP